MTMQEMNTVMPKSAARVKVFNNYTSRASFINDCQEISKEKREVIKNELGNTFRFDVHTSGQMLVVTLYFSAKGIDDAERYKYVAIDLRGEEIECELLSSVQAAKEYVVDVLNGIDTAKALADAEARAAAKRKAKEEAEAAKAEKPAEKPAEKTGSKSTAKAAAKTAIANEKAERPKK